MYKKTLTYTDYNDETRTEDFYFNLSKAEIMEMELSIPGGYEALLDKIIKSRDQVELIKLFKDLILRTYGEKSPDGRRFMKSPEITKNFQETEAYSDLFMLLATDDKEASAFVNGVMPASLRDSIDPKELDKMKQQIKEGTYTGISMKEASGSAPAVVDEK